MPAACKKCGSSEIDTDPARGDAVCTSCGVVLEESIIVSEVTFEDDGHGGSSAIGQFVSSDSRGGGGIGGTSMNFHSSIGKESREITLRNANNNVKVMAQKLKLNQHCIDMACNFFKMALYKQLTKGRKSDLTIAACVYITCRLEGTPHLLIDFCDIVQMDVFSLGRAYIQISRGLFINIPAVDPCLFLVRFAHRLDLGDKTHEVSMTALRLVQRMKRDWIHLGRRPSGVCGAALLIAARLHNFSRTVQDIINIVKVHETTLRKRLIEFGETPSSSLTMDEFLSVDLEEEHDPPSYKAARIKDREDLQKLLDVVPSKELTEMQIKIEGELDKRKKKIMLKDKIFEVTAIGSIDESSSCSSIDASIGRVIVESNKDTFEELISSADDSSVCSESPRKKFKKEIKSEPIKKERETIKEELNKSSNESGKGMELVLYVGPKNEEGNKIPQPESIEDSGEIDLEGIDDAELDRYIMDPVEVKKKTKIWEEINADYIISQKLKMEQLEIDKLEGKAEKKKKKTSKDKKTYKAKSADEAIRIMLTEKKHSKKIDYDVLNSLTKSLVEAQQYPSIADAPGGQLAITNTVS